MSLSTACPELLKELFSSWLGMALGAVAKG